MRIYYFYKTCYYYVDLQGGYAYCKHSWFSIYDSEGKRLISFPLIECFIVCSIQAPVVLYTCYRRLSTCLYIRAKKTDLILGAHTLPRRPQSHDRRLPSWLSRGFPWQRLAAVPVEPRDDVLAETDVLSAGRPRHRRAAGRHRHRCHGVLLAQRW